MLPLLGLVFVLSLIGGILFYQHIKPDASNTLLAILFFGPAVLVWVGDKDLSELGVGGIYAKFQSTIKDLPLEKAVTSLTTPPEHTGLTEASPLGECAPILRLQPNRVPKDSAKATNEYIVHSTGALGSSLACGKLLGVVVLDKYGRYRGSFDGKFFSEATSLWMIFKSDTPEGNALVRQKLSPNQYEFWANMIKYRTVFGPALLTPDERIEAGEGFVAYVKETDSIRYAWEELQDTRGNFLAVTDRRLKFKSVLTRKAVEQLLLDQIAGGPRRRPAVTRTEAPIPGPPPRHPYAPVPKTSAAP